MAQVLGIVGVVVIVLVNSAIAALLTRFLRVRLHTRWASMLYTLVLTPFVLFLTIWVYSLAFGSVLEFGSSFALISVTIVLPLAIGITFDYFWMPSPEEVELPETT